jgi:periplasmic copper chaperone A
VPQIPFGRFFFIAAVAVFIGLPQVSAWAGSSSNDKTVFAENAFARATIGAGKTGVVYLTIHNPTDTPDSLIGASTVVAKRAATHTHLHENGVMKMRPVESIEIPARGMAILKPGGDHLMLMGLTAPLKKGDHFSVTLVFRNAGEITAMVKVGSVGAKNAGHGGHTVPKN